MDTTNSSETPQRRVEDRKPEEVIDWAAPGAPAVPLSPAATSGTDDFMVYGRAGNRRADLEAKLRDALAADTATASGDELADFERAWPGIHKHGFDDGWRGVALAAWQARAAVSAATKPTACALPPTGWTCTRVPGHEGPCAAVATEVCADDYTPEQMVIYQHGVEDGKLVARGMERYKAGIAAREAATKPAASAAVPEGFAEWLSREMPAGTVINDPAWWAPRIVRALAAAPAASTTGAAQTAEQSKRQQEYDAAQEAGRAHRDQWLKQRGIVSECAWDDLSADDRAGWVSEARIAARPTPTHSSEAGDA